MDVEELRNEDINPWKRRSLSEYDSDEEIVRRFGGIARKRGRQLVSSRTPELDIYTKRAALKIAPSLVALVSYTGDQELCKGCGTIIEADNDNNMTVLTSANLVRRPTTGIVVENDLADNLKVDVVVAEGKFYKGEIVVYDFHYNILVLRFQSSSPLSAARLAHINDSLSLSVTEKKPFELHRHSTKLIPGDSVVALGRYSVNSFDIVALPGIFCMDQCLLDCKELCLVTCRITRVKRDSHAHSSGLLKGDIIVQCGDKKLHSFLELAEMMWSHEKMRRPSCILISLLQKLNLINCIVGLIGLTE